ncbi:MAG: cytochrome bc complex cytochrome b subunit [Ignavibacteria bacterium]|nr:cytochrome bc complex cytochrome b subunit [Ignavibacteria bacterium]
MFGGLALFFFIVQIVTGILLLLYYSPTPNTANESVRVIVNQVSFGWLVRSLHSWSANLMIATVILHLFSTYFMKAYRKPRELMWVSGVFLLFLVLGFGFTGYLLPWDTTAYFATQIGTEIPRSIPVLGEFIVRLLRGGEFIDEESLKRLFALHVVILPLITLAVVLFHLILNQVHGTSIPIGIRSLREPIPFFPNYLFRDAIAWIAALILLFGLCLIFPVQIGPKADPFASAPVGIKPEWYFLTLYQTLRIVPAAILGVNSETIVNVCVGIAGAFLLMTPMIDRKARMEQYSSGFTWIGVVAIFYVIIAISLAYLT